jgi:uncharacterized membrane protein
MLSPTNRTPNAGSEYARHREALGEFQRDDGSLANEVLSVYPLPPGIPSSLLEKARSDAALTITGALITAFALFFGVLSVQRHQAFLTTAFDLGNYDQAVWNTSQGRPFAQTNIPEINVRLGHHVEPTLLLLAPLYWLWSDVRLLLLIQAGAVALGSLPLFWLTRRFIGPWPAVALVAAYLLVPALQGAVLFDFHAVTLAPTFLMLALHWMFERRDRSCFVATLLATGCKEEIGLLVALMGCYILLIQRRRFGLLPLTLGLSWSLLAFGWIIPFFHPGGAPPQADRYAHLGGGIVGVVHTAVTQPSVIVRLLLQPPQLTYLGRLLLPVAWLALLAPEILLLASPSLAINLLSSYAPMQTLEGFHYPAPLMPFVFVATALGLHRLARWAGRHKHLVVGSAMVLLLGASLSYHAQHGYTPLARGFVWPVVTAHDRLGQAIAARIPANAQVSAQWRLNPHVSQRRGLWQFPERGSQQQGLTADTIFLDVTDDALVMHPNDLKRAIEGLLTADWGIVVAQDGWLLLRQGMPQHRLPAEFFDFARQPLKQESSTGPMFKIEADFGGLLRLLGYSLSLSPTGVEATFFWRPLQPISEPLKLWPTLSDPISEGVLADTSQQPLLATLWYPPTRWQMNETIRTTTLPWSVQGDFDLNMAVQAEAGLLPVRVHSSDLVVAEGDGQLRLLGIRGGQLAPVRRLSSPPPEMSPLDVRFAARPSEGSESGKKAWLYLRANRAPTRASPGEALSVTLAWQTGSVQPATAYTAFVQLLSPAGQLVTQHDSQPADGSRPTTGWLPNEVVLDTHKLVLPHNLPPGNYHLIAGLYNVASGERLPLHQDGQAVPSKAARLGTIQVLPP